MLIINVIRDQKTRGFLVGNTRIPNAWRCIKDIVKLILVGFWLDQKELVKLRITVFGFIVVIEIQGFAFIIKTSIGNGRIKRLIAN